MHLDDKDFERQRTIITIAGQIGSGKSEVCRQLNKRTGWDIVSAGAIMRRAAMRSGMTILQMNEFAISHAEIDAEVDNYLISLRQGSESIIVDSRLAWHFLPSSFKVYLIVEPQVGAQRIFEATRLDEKYPSVGAALTDSIERQRLETERYMELYGVDCQLWHNYNLIVDTTHASPEQVASLILEKIKPFQEAKSYSPGCWISPKRLIPTEGISEIAGDREVPVGSEVDGREYDPTVAVGIGVYKGSYLIVTGHSSVSATIRNGDPLISCGLVAFEFEDITPGLSLRRFAETSTSLPLIHEWEETHRFRFITYPPWLIEGEGKPTTSASNRA